jgi:hypothetical protein
MRCGQRQNTYQPSLLLWLFLDKVWNPYASA